MKNLIFKFFVFPLALSPPSRPVLPSRPIPIVNFILLLFPESFLQDFLWRLNCESAPLFLGWCPRTAAVRAGQCWGGRGLFHFSPHFLVKLGQLFRGELQTTDSLSRHLGIKDHLFYSLLLLQDYWRLPPPTANPWEITKVTWWSSDHRNREFYSKIKWWRPHQ